MIITRNKHFPQYLFPIITLNIFPHTMAIKPDIDSVNVFQIKHIKLLEQFYIPNEAIILVNGDVASENKILSLSLNIKSLER